MTREFGEEEDISEREAAESKEQMVNERSSEFTNPNRHSISDPLVGQALSDNYLVIDKIGVGGMAVVLAGLKKRGNPARLLNA
jgi:hypothetical protein